MMESQCCTLEPVYMISLRHFETYEDDDQRRINRLRTLLVSSLEPTYTIFTYRKLYEDTQQYRTNGFAPRKVRN